jgi:ribonuclease P protein component
MLPKKNRADTKTVEKIFKLGKFINSPNLTFKFISTGDKKTRISFIAPKSVAKLAVQRNSLRRLGYSALQKNWRHSPVGLSGVFIFRKSEKDVSILENEIKTILAKIN